jgi:hypothetical protein
VGLFQSDIDERVVRARSLLTPLGFDARREYAKMLHAHLPFLILPKPHECLIGAFGSVDGRDVEIFEYAMYENTFQRTGEQTWLVVVARDEWINGGAAFVSQSNTAREILEGMELVSGALERIFDGKTARHAREGTFEDLYRVEAATPEAAERAITPALRDVCLEIEFEGTVELASGALLFSPANASFDERLPKVLDLVSKLLAAFGPPPADHPMR